MKTTIISSNFYPESTGLGPYSTKLAEHLAETGQLAKVITTFPHYPNPSFWKTTSHDLGGQNFEIVRKRHYVTQVPVAIGRLVSEFHLGLLFLGTSFGANTIYVATSPALLPSLFSLAKVTLARKGQFVLWVQDFYAIGLAELKKPKCLVGLFRSLEKFLFRHSDVVVFIHPKSVQILDDFYGYRGDNIRVIRNWNHVKTGLGFTRKAFLPGPREDVRILHIGNMGVKQGLHQVIEAARLAQSQGLNYRFVFTGGGSQESHLRQMADGLDNVEFLGSLSEEDLSRELESAHVALLVEAEGVANLAVPSKFTTYCGFGLPVVGCVNQAGMAAFEIRESNAGIVTSEQSAAGLLAGIQDLLAAQSKLPKYSASALRYANETLSEEKAMEAWRNLIEELSSNP